MKRNQFIIKLMFVITLICTYIIPITMLEKYYPNVSKLLFIIIASFAYLLKMEKVNIKECLLLTIISLLTLYTKNINYLLFISLLLLPKIINNDSKKFIKEFIKKSKILELCLLFTIFYSFLYLGLDGRYIHTGLTSPNQSGLAIFCLAMLLMKKNKKTGIFTLILGCLTLSRSYFLAIIIYIFSKSKIYKNIKEKTIKKANYFNLTIVFTILLFGLGIFYIIQYNQGNIVSDTINSGRLFHLLDYSNFFRFTAVVIVLSIFRYNFSTLLFGMTEEYYIEHGIDVSKSLGIPYHHTVPHNLFLAHLKLYGLFSVIEVIYTSKILKTIVNKNNFYLFIIIFLYSSVLGAGLYSYWLYLSILVLIEYEEINEGVNKNG